MTKPLPSEDRYRKNSNVLQGILVKLYKIIIPLIETDWKPQIVKITRDRTCHGIFKRNLRCIYGKHS